MNSKYFSILDFANGFHQIAISPEHRHEIAFSTPTGHYSFIRMPFGLKNATASIQSMMNDNFINNICVYLDDTLVVSTSLQEHIVSLKIFFKDCQSVISKYRYISKNFSNVNLNV